MNKRNSLIIYLISLILGGIVLGGIPNAVMPIQTLLSTIITGPKINLILPIIVILIVLLFTVFLFGRIFCGYACPLGALQELASRFKFKSNLKEQKHVKYNLDISYKISTIIRWVFFGILIVLAVVWSLNFLQVINPFTGFKFFTNPIITLYIVPAIFLGLVFIASFFIYRPWCRLFCPFGAVASIVGQFSLKRYVRTDACTDCGLCEKICPTHKASINSSKNECYYCNRCVEICPSDAIEFR
ncbi:MAG: 4Fe-4S binding protein [Candidatus Helarchaeota archaeon]